MVHGFDELLQLVVVPLARYGHAGNAGQVGESEVVLIVPKDPKLDGAVLDLLFFARRPVGVLSDLVGNSSVQGYALPIPEGRASYQRMLVSTGRASEHQYQRHAGLDALPAGQIHPAQSLEEARLAVALVAGHHDAGWVDLAFSRQEAVDPIVELDEGPDVFFREPFQGGYTS